MNPLNIIYILCGKCGQRLLEGGGGVFCFCCCACACYSVPLLDFADITGDRVRFDAKLVMELVTYDTVASSMAE